jgi:hypothetical protein
MASRGRSWEKALAFVLVACPIEVFANLDRGWGVEVILAMAAVFLALVLVGVVWPRRRREASRPPPPVGGAADGW